MGSDEPEAIGFSGGGGGRRRRRRLFLVFVGRWVQGNRRRRGSTELFEFGVERFFVFEGEQATMDFVYVQPGILRRPIRLSKLSQGIGWRTRGRVRVGLMPELPVKKV
jgi:hypothetical protein